MKRHYLGELEELILMAVCTLHPEAYGVSIRHELLEQMKRGVTLSTIHVCLHRMEEKGFLKSHFGESNGSRGGKPKRIFSATAYGVRVLQDVRKARERMWDSIPRIVLQRK